ncbi:CPBP family intramembrane glutamic endopeptidase [Sporolactobacillus spathodeae]|uniref:Membrane protease YdiL (CAAX protease family) n=1 Tax=Sporolactobacillus spathodeae TaxID=1465502 RepID=A0ABS2Q9G2_9BACL|nr:type II CAAX endopeptidase family protein [Sporolactobacillus spathodeae]MBM7658428.1 membrane protease YdiL (CAAX protease family) [Sporolactobacillus spathodeae]
MVKRYAAIVVLYVCCVLSPLIPFFKTIAQLFPNPRDGYGIIYTAIFGLTLLAVLLLLAPERHLRAADRATLSESILWAILGIFALFALQSLAVFINTFLFHQPAASTHTKDVIQLTRYSPLFIFTVSIIGPILEEVVFRKIFFGGLRRKMPFILAAAISSIVFAVFHADLQHTLIYFVIGFFLCYVYQRTGRIWVTMMMHAGMNATVVAINFAVGTAQLIAHGLH